MGDDPRRSGVLHAAELGAGEPVIVLLHGFGGLGSAWDTIAETLSADARVLAYDLPGHGRSLHFPGAGPVKVAVKAILEDLDARKIDRFHLVGHSMGGAISALIAISAPQRVRSLVLLSPGGMGPEINAAVLKRFGAAREPAQIMAALAEMSAPDAAPPSASLAELAQARQAEGQSDMLARIAEHITRDGRQGVIPKEALAALSMPVTVIWGRCDSVLPFAQTANLPPSFKLLPVDAVGHMLIEEAPDTVLDAIRRAAGIALKD